MKFTHLLLSYFLLTLILCLPAAGAVSKPVLVHGDMDVTERAIFLAFSIESPENFQAARLYPGTEDKVANLIKNKKDLRPILVLGDNAYKWGIKSFPKEKLIAVGISFDFAKNNGRKQDYILLRDLPLNRKFDILKTLFPSIKTVGMIYNPKEDKKNVAELIAATRRSKYRLATVKVDSSQSVADQLTVFKGKIDLFWLIGSKTMRSKEVIKSAVQFCTKNSIPVFSADPSLIGKGASVSVRSSPDALGTLAARWVKKLLAKEKAPSIGFPERSEIVISLKKMKSPNLLDRLEKLVKKGNRVFLER